MENEKIKIFGTDASSDKKSTEIKYKVRSGWALVIPTILGFLLGIGGIVGGASALGESAVYAVLIVVGVILIIISLILVFGFKINPPNIALIFTFFGRYVGTTRQNGVLWKNPFFSSQPISIKLQNLTSHIIKVNDKTGNPIEIGAVSVWHVEDTYKSRFVVQNYVEFINVQFETAVREMASQYSYDISTKNDNTEDLTLRGNPAEVSEALTIALQERVKVAGIVIKEARISHLAYAPEIAAAMLKRQQATAIIEAREKIVKGATDMVKMSIKALDADNTVKLSADVKAQMAADLMLILSGDKEVIPTIDVGSSTKKR